MEPCERIWLKGEPWKVQVVEKASVPAIRLFGTVWTQTSADSTAIGSLVAEVLGSRGKVQALQALQFTCLSCAFIVTNLFCTLVQKHRVLL